mgnify:CR=1 FL=1
MTLFLLLLCLQSARWLIYLIKIITFFLTLSYIVWNFQGITNILQQDNLQKEIPLSHRINLELDIQGAISSGIFTVARDLLIKVKALNHVRCIMDQKFLNEFSLSNGKHVETLLWVSVHKRLCMSFRFKIIFNNNGLVRWWSMMSLIYFQYFCYIWIMYMYV